MVLLLSLIHISIMAGSYLLVIIFGAVISGFGLGLALKKGASTGGVDIIQQILLDRFKIPFSISLLMIEDVYKRQTLW